MEKYIDNIMFIPACVLMVVEAMAVIFLVWAWFDAKRHAKMDDKDSELVTGGDSNG